tara:strand:+ start:786 stop:1163 length:378 start_codon:yes stop_codon:yes gene_type:complete
VKNILNDKTINFFSLFASTSTLICCALPAVFVLLGAGASFASLLTFFPFLITISKYKVIISIFAFITILIAGYLNFKAQNLICPADKELGELCTKTRKKSLIIYSISVIIFLVASFFTYIFPLFL